MTMAHVCPQLTSVESVRSTGGALTLQQRASFLGPILLGLLRVIRAFLPLRSARGGAQDPTVPDSRLTRLAQEAALDQPAAVTGHGLRTFSFGGALALRDGVKLDSELFYVAALLHDAGLTRAVTGEDFTLRSAALALDACTRAGVSEGQRAIVADSIVAHITPGLTVEQGRLGFYIQAGALLDLVGARMRDLPQDFLQRVYARHPQHGMRALIVNSLARERAAVPGGRVALLHCAGFEHAIRLAPTRHF
ncbi:MAG: hypothetical protein JWN48_361 [Myxococcaceae bacterium]|nr:hypothetical protein [Myxococcaceae bacterium]